MVNIMVEIFKSSHFDGWLRGLRDVRAVARIQVRIDYGPGYRVYFMRRGSVVIVLLCGDDKSSQRQDIEAAKAPAAEWKE